MNSALLILSCLVGAIFLTLTIKEVFFSKLTQTGIQHYHITYVTQKGIGPAVFHSGIVICKSPVVWLYQKRQKDPYTRYHLIQFNTDLSYRALGKEFSLEHTNGVS